MSSVTTRNFFFSRFFVGFIQERGGRGSRLVLCTDGLANVGLGALDDLKSDEEREAAEQFYAQLGVEVSAWSCCGFCVYCIGAVFHDASYVDGALYVTATVMLAFFQGLSMPFTFFADASIDKNLRRASSRETNRVSFSAGGPPMYFDTRSRTPDEPDIVQVTPIVNYSRHSGFHGTLYTTAAV